MTQPAGVAVGVGPGGRTGVGVAEGFGVGVGPVVRPWTCMTTVSRLPTRVPPGSRRRHTVVKFPATVGARIEIMTLAVWHGATAGMDTDDIPIRRPETLSSRQPADQGTVPEL